MKKDRFLIQMEYTIGNLDKLSLVSSYYYHLTINSELYKKYCKKKLSKLFYGCYPFKWWKERIKMIVNLIQDEEYINKLFSIEFYYLTRRASTSLFMS